MKPSVYISTSNSGEKQLTLLAYFSDGWWDNLQFHFPVMVGTVGVESVDVHIDGGPGSVVIVLIESVEMKEDF